MDIYYNFVNNNIINDNTILVLHDTNLHYPPFQHCGVYIEKEDGFAHQPVERNMINIFKNLGYDIFSISTDRTKHSIDFPVRHGVSVCKKFKILS